MFRQHKNNVGELLKVKVLMTKTAQTQFKSYPFYYIHTERFLKYQLQYQLWEFTEFLPQPIFKFYCWNKSFRKSQEIPVSAFSQIHFVDYNQSQTFPIYLHLHEVAQYIANIFIVVKKFWTMLDFSPYIDMCPMQFLVTELK